MTDPWVHSSTSATVDKILAPDVQIVQYDKPSICRVVNPHESSRQRFENSYELA